MCPIARLWIVAPELIHFEKLRKIIADHFNGPGGAIALVCVSVFRAIIIVSTLRLHQPSYLMQNARLDSTAKLLRHIGQKIYQEMR